MMSQDGATELRISMILGYPDGVPVLSLTSYMYTNTAFDTEEILFAFMGQGSPIPSPHSRCMIITISTARAPSCRLL